MDELLLRALAGGLLLAALLGPLGAFVVWRRMAYFGDTIAHSALLGVALSLLAGGAIPMTAAIFLVAVAVAALLARYGHDTRFHTDTLLGILAHGTLALGLVLVSLNSRVQVDVNAYLFGDVLAMDWADVGLLAALALVVLLVLRLRWRALLMTTIDPAIAQVEGVNIARTQLLLTLLLAAVIAVAIQLTGILLITALLVMPAATARYFARTPLQMAVRAGIVGMLSVGGGLLAALHIDAPAAPMMVVVAAVLFIASSVVGAVRG
ncbi:MAG: iron chelate uptake ABC transporter family permease subunit [Alphaproteobacteria bacterium]|nr:iron chelate uptake ABC transporter family permease subunit [Alphaproteobacteria bacterium]